MKDGIIAVLLIVVVILGICLFSTKKIIQNPVENKETNLVENFENEEINEISNEEIVKPNDFCGTWVTGRTTIEISKISNNTFEVSISWGNSASETYMWEYTGNFDEMENVLKVSDGIMRIVNFNENGKETAIEKYNDGTAEFTLKNEKLIWNDLKENAAEDLEFERLIIPNE